MHRFYHVSYDENVHNHEQDKNDYKEFQHSELNDLEELVTKLQKIADNFDLCMIQADNRNITPKSQDESPIGNIGQDSLMHASNSNGSSPVETCNSVRHEILFKNLPVADNNHDIPYDTSISGSIFQIQHNEVQSNLNISFQTSSKHFEPGYRFENSFCGAQKRKLSPTEAVYKENDCEIKSSTSFHLLTSDKSDTSLEEEKLHSLNTDKEFFLENLEDAAKKFRLEPQNMSKASNCKQSLFLLGNKQSNTDVVRISRDIRIRDISSELVSQVHNQSIAMPENGKETVNSSKHTNAVAGPSGFGLKCLAPAGKRTFSCDMCYKIFPCKSKLDIHYKCHTDEKPFVCDVCGRGFAQKGHLKYHYTTHNVGIHLAKPFTCNICNRGYERKNSLVRHFRIHTKEKSYICKA